MAPKGQIVVISFPLFYSRSEGSESLARPQSGRQCGCKPEGAGLQPEALSQAPKGQSSFSLTPILSVASVVLQPAGLYYKRKELIALVDKPKPAQRSETQQNTQGRLHILCYGWSSPCEVKIISAFLLCNHPISS